MASLADIKREEEEVNAQILNANQKPAQLDTGEKEKNAPEQNTGTPENTDSGAIWEQKYKALQGKYNAEVPRLQQEIANKSDNSAEIQRLQSEISSLKQENLNLQQQAKQEPVENKDDLMRQFEDEYGPELAKGIETLISKKLSGNQNNEEVTKLRGDVETMQKATQEQAHAMRIDTLTAKLQSQGVDFKQMDEDPLFHQWLSEEEASTGMSRQHFLSQNFANGDLDRCAAYYVNYKAHERSSLGNSNPLEQHVDVSSNNQQSEAGQEQDIWTPDDVIRMYDAHMRKEITDEELKAYEQQLFRAQAEGRFRS